MQNPGKSDSPTLENSARITSISSKSCNPRPSVPGSRPRRDPGNLPVIQLGQLCRPFSGAVCKFMHACSNCRKRGHPASPLPLPCPAQVPVGLDPGEVPNASRYGSHSVSSGTLGTVPPFLLYLWEFFVTTLTSSGLSHIYLLYSSDHVPHTFGHVIL